MSTTKDVVNAKLKIGNSCSVALSFVQDVQPQSAWPLLLVYYRYVEIEDKEYFFRVRWSGPGEYQALELCEEFTIAEEDTKFQSHSSLESACKSIGLTSADAKNPEVKFLCRVRDDQGNNAWLGLRRARLKKYICVSEPSADHQQIPTAIRGPRDHNEKAASQCNEEKQPSEQIQVSNEGFAVEEHSNTSLASVLSTPPSSRRHVPDDSEPQPDSEWRSDPSPMTSPITPTHYLAQITLPSEESESPPTPSPSDASHPFHASYVNLSRRILIETRAIVADLCFNPTDPAFYTTHERLRHYFEFFLLHPRSPPPPLLPHDAVRSSAHAFEWSRKLESNEIPAQTFWAIFVREAKALQEHTLAANPTNTFAYQTAPKFCAEAYSALLDFACALCFQSSPPIVRLEPCNHHGKLCRYCAALLSICFECNMPITGFK